MRGMRARRSFQRVAPLAAAIAVFWVAVASADQLLDRVVARVGDDAITQTDVRAAIGFGIVDPGAAPDPERAALAQLIDRRLELAEIPRAQPEPDDTSVEAELARMKQHAGPKASVLMATTGVDDERLRDLSRDTLRLQTYLENRFPNVPVSDAEAEKYFRAHPDAFGPRSFEQAAADARVAAAAERRRTRIAQWLTGLRRGVEVVITTPPSSQPAAPPAN
jgi:hypothetical protein